MDPRDIQLQSQDRYLQMVEKQLDEERIRRLQTQNQQAQTDTYNINPNKNLVEYQLDIEKELDDIKHQLSGHMLVKDEEGNEVWRESPDDRLRIFSEYGVNQIMNLLMFYINKNTLLSFYDEETIVWKIRDFGIELADLIFCRYEVFFSYPSPEELYEKYLPIVQHNNIDITDDELYSKCLQWSVEELQSKFRHYNIICKALIDAVDSTYRRALKGEERDSLRKFMHISQNANFQPNNQVQPTKFKLLSPSTWNNG